MRFWTLTEGRRSFVAAAVLVTSVAAFGWSVAAQDAEPPTVDTPTVKTKKRHSTRKAPLKSAESNAATAAPLRSVAPPEAPSAQSSAVPTGATAAPATAAVSAPPGKGAEPIEFTAQLDKAGASACSSQVNALATSTMGSVVKYNTVSNWSEVGGDKRAVSVAIGQKYADGSAVPFSVSQVIASPNRAGSCDGFTVQVFPSPLPCEKLRDSLASRGRQIGDLAGIPLMQDATARTMLIPTVGNACVLVATRTVYAK